jgi:ribosome-binding protein aMBF1 (putative translation factor)
MKKSIPYEKVIAKLPAARRVKIAARAKELIAEVAALRDIRKSRSLSQEQVAKKLGGKQVYVSRLESRSDVKVSTLRGYVRALGGDLELIVTFPEGTKAKIGDLGL